VIAVHMSVQPADEKHPFGHGKMEGISALIQAFLVLGAGGFIIYSAIQRIIQRTVIKPDAGIAVMVISIIASYFLSRHLRRVAKATESTAIDASAQTSAPMFIRQPGYYWDCWPCLLPVGKSLTLLLL